MNAYDNFMDDAIGITFLYKYKYILKRNYINCINLYKAIYI